MCESTVFLRRGETEEKLAEEVAKVIPDGDEVRVITLLGDEQRVRAVIRDIDLMAHRITLEAR